MVSEHEKLDIGTAYYKDGFLDGHKQGKEEGIEEGITIGRTGEKADIAKNLLEMGMPVADIVKATGLTEDEVAKLIELQ